MNCDRISEKPVLSWLIEMLKLHACKAPCHDKSTSSHSRFPSHSIKRSNALTPCLQVVSCRLQMTESLLQKTAEEQGASEAIGDKLIRKGIALMDSMAVLVDR